MLGGQHVTIRTGGDESRQPVLPVARPRARREAVPRLWDELADFPAAETDAALTHLMRTLCGWLRADDALWIGGVRLLHDTSARRDGQHGWRGRVLRRLVPPSPELVARSLQAMREQDTDPGLTTRVITARAGQFRVYRLRDGFIDFEAFRRTPHYHTFYKGMGINDRLWALFPLNADTESCFVFDHVGSKRRFSRADAALVEHVLRAIRWFHRKLMLSHGLGVADAPLSPTQRTLLARLLTDMTEREIAETMGLRPGTVHQYAVRLYQRFGVKGRAGLMALWLGR
jgi:DNA-binding CsgD family transcriptional regulator